MKELQKFDIYPGKDYKPIKTIDNRHNYKRVSRWITIRQNYSPCKNNRLWDYVTDENGYKPYQEQFNPANGLFLDYFRFNGRTFAIEQIISIGSIADCIGHSSGYIENKQEHFLSGYDCENYYSPIFVELDEYGDKVRIYEEV